MARSAAVGGGGGNRSPRKRGINGAAKETAVYVLLNGCYSSDKGACMKLLLCLLFALAIQACAHQVLPRNLSIDSLERARFYAIKYCVGFYDETNGIYAIDTKGSTVRYRGQPKHVEHWFDLTITWSRKSGKLNFMSTGNALIYPLDILNRGALSQRCRTYDDYHDSGGRQIRSEWNPYK